MSPTLFRQFAKSSSVPMICFSVNKEEGALGPEQLASFTSSTFLPQICVICFLQFLRKNKWSLDIQSPLYLSLVCLKTLLLVTSQVIEKKMYWYSALNFGYSLVLFFSSPGRVFTTLSFMLISLCTDQSGGNVFFPHLLL